MGRGRVGRPGRAARLRLSKEGPRGLPCLQWGSPAAWGGLWDVLAALHDYDRAAGEVSRDLPCLQQGSPWAAKPDARSGTGAVSEAPLLQGSFIHAARGLPCCIGTWQHCAWVTSTRAYGTWRGAARRVGGVNTLHRSDWKRKRKGGMRRSRVAAVEATGRRRQAHAGARSPGGREHTYSKVRQRTVNGLVGAFSV